MSGPAAAPAAAPGLAMAMATVAGAGAGAALRPLFAALAGETAHPPPVILAAAAAYDASLVSLDAYLSSVGL